MHAGLSVRGDDWDSLAIHPGIQTQELRAAVLKCDKPLIIRLVVGAVVRGDGFAESDERTLHTCTNRPKENTEYATKK